MDDAKPRPALTTTPDIVSGMLGASSQEWRTKTVILIRHGRSTWNEFLGAHKKAAWEEQERKRTGFRGAIKQMVGLSHGHDAGNDVDDRDGGFWQGVRGGVKHAVNAFTHAGRLHQVDHPLSAGGVAQARALRGSVAAVVADPRESPASVLLRCRQWYVSPFVRALQTAAYALAPLQRRDPTLRLQVTPLAGEIVNNAMALDCQGKKGNVGFRMITRAISKLAESFDDDEDDPQNRGLMVNRQAEFSDITHTLCAMDLSEVTQVWWTEIGTFSKEHLKSEDVRVRKLIGLIMSNPDSHVGVVAHSLLFKRIMQMAWPKDAVTQHEVRLALHNGASSDAKDPLQDKIMNCGTLVLTMRCRPDTPQHAEITKAVFLFDGHMESALSRDMQAEEAAEGGEYEDLENFFKDTDLDLL